MCLKSKVAAWNLLGTVESRLVNHATALALVLFSAVLDGAETTRIRFTALSKSTPGGLRSDLVRAISQDIGGYVWIATDQGLHRFDGFQTIHYARNPDSPTSLPSDQLTALATSRGSNANANGPLWIGTSSSGLARFSPASGEAIWLRKGSNKGENLLSDQITSLGISEDRFLWIGTEAGLNVMNLATESIVVAEGPLGATSIASITTLGPNHAEIWIGTTAGDLYKWNQTSKSFEKFWSTSVPVTSVAMDTQNRVWIGTAGMGLFSYAPDHGSEPKRYPLPEKSHITSIFIDSNSDLWVGTRSGLALYDRGNDSFITFNHTPRHADSLCDDQITTIFEDRSKMLWVATLGGGTSRFSLERQWFPHIRHNAERHDGLPHPMIHSFTDDGKGNVWIGTGRGLALWDARSDSFLATPSNESLEAGIACLLRDQEGRLWIGTNGAGLVERSPDGVEVIHRHEESRSNPLGHDNISDLCETRGGIVFIATYGGGLYRHEPEKDEFFRIKADTVPSTDFILGLAEDGTGNLWVAAQTGVYLLTPESSTLQTLHDAFPNAAPLTSERVSTILPDSNGIVWIGTLDAGLDRFNTSTGEVANFSMALHGLPDDQISALIKDRKNLLWVSTRTGVARLNAMQSEFRVFDEEDGLLRSGFNRGAAIQDTRGRLYFGGQDGFNIIDPEKLPPMPRSPNPILSSFEYFGKPVIPHEGGILEKPIAATDEISIPFDPRLIFSIGFANLDYRFPTRGHFQYRLTGYDDDWIAAGEDRKATYAGLPAGDYEFQVQSSLDGHNWPDVTTKVRIIVSPPWWQTGLAKTLGILALILASAGITRYSLRHRVRQMQRHEEMLTAQRDRAEAALARQLQNRVLLDRSYRNLRNETPGDQVLSGALQGIVEDFRATHCLVFRLINPQTDDQDYNEDYELKRIGLWSALNTTQIGENGNLPELDLHSPLARQVLASKSALTLPNSSALPESILRVFPERTPVSALAATTSFLDSSNGIILLLRTGQHESWTEEEGKLLDALTGQFGIAIAQIQTAEIEGTYRDHLEEARHHAEVANRAKSDFLAKMTHELRTPLNAIIGFSTILAEDKTLTPKQRETLDIINNSGEHLLDVINEILDLSKIEAGKMEKNDETFEFLPLLKSVYEMLSMKANEKRIAFNFSARSSLPGEIVTDRSKLRQILINLIGNAIKFTAQGGVGVSVSAEQSGEPETIEGRLRRRVRIVFEIRDTGRGIREDEIGKLFERYSQTESGRRSSEGTGLGLPIARSFVQLMGGDIEVTSVLGKGTTFRFSIECEELAPVEATAEVATLALDEKSAQRINGFSAP
ncbi:MAG: hypothetical protein KDN18_22445, partial [Verrucomicrobiae bacterium]|nr:hypothetical protein [Verrucomicrobiae bacterium]